MKLAHVLRRFVPSEWGGIETVVAATTREFSRAGVDAEIVATSALSTPGADRYDGLRVRRFRHSYLRLPPLNRATRALDKKGGNPTSPGLFRHLLREPELDLICSHTMGRLGGHVRRAARLRGIPYVVFLHGGHYVVPSDERDRLRAPTRTSVDVGRPLDWLFGTSSYLRDASAIVALSAEEADAAESALPAKPILRIPNGVEADRFGGVSAAERSEVRRAWGVDDEDFVVLCVARLDPQKGQDRLIDAVAAVDLSRPVHLVLVGPESVPDYGAALDDRARAAGLGGRYHRVGSLPYGDRQLARAYAAADVFALASRHEPFGVVLLEAWAAGVPVVASRVGGIPGFVEHDETGWLVDPDEPGELANGLRAVLSDSARATRLTASAHKQVMSTYSWERITGELIEAFRELAGSRRDRGG